MAERIQFVKLVWSKKNFKRSVKSGFSERVASDASFKTRWLLEVQFLPSGHITNGCLNIFLQTLGSNDYPLVTTYELKLETSGQLLYDTKGNHMFTEFGMYVEDSINEAEFEDNLVDDILMVTIDLKVCINKVKGKTSPTSKQEIQVLNTEQHSKVLKNTWRNNIYNMLLSRSLTDVIVVSENVYIGAHKVVLASGSKVLKRLLEAGSSTNSIQLLELHHYNYETTHEIIKFLYTRRSPPFIQFDHCLVLSILEAAHTFDVPALQHLASRHILSNLNDRNVVDTAIVARRSGFTELQNHTSEYISAKKEGLKLPEKFKDFLKLPELMNSVLGQIAEEL